VSPWLKLRVVVLSAAIIASAGAWAQQSYPAKPIRIIVPYAAAGGTDTVTRLLAQKMTESMGQQIVVENRPGANGIIGSDLVAKSAPDGYTLLMTTNALTTNPWLYKLPYDSEKDFAPITITAAADNLLAVHPSLPANSVKELIALARQRPGQLVIAASGAGQPSHLSGELLKQMAKIDLTTVQYKGTGASLADLAGGHVMITFASVPGLGPLVRTRKLRALAVSGPKRNSSLPQIPTVGETLPGFEVMVWYGLVAPARTPQDVISRLHDEIKKALARADVKAMLDSSGFESGGTSPSDFADVIKKDLVRWERVIKQAGIKVQ
jgi:tripartite-type tricarboxylate transporter receptor subunit TctC